jgi:hypothetical protein
MSLSSLVCVVGNKMVDNGPGVFAVFLIGSAVTCGAWVVLNSTSGRVVL